MILDLLTGLARANLAAAAAIVVVALLRTPARRAFGARAAYGLWLAPVLAAAATLVPPASVAVPLAPLAPEVVAAVGGAVEAGVAAAPGLPAAMFALWIAGSLAAAALLLWRQARYMAAIARREAGPAVVGALRPRIVTPGDFETRFDAAEREVILAHEGAHLRAGDARINALAAAALCACWFNPLVHVAIYLMRLDQELACDAAVLGAFPQARRLYAEVLLKTQLATQPLPFGCHWPAAAEHPLKVRIVMLKSPLPATARRLAGLAAVALLSATGAAAAWAAQPGQPKPAPALAVATTAPAPAVLPDWILRPDMADVMRFYPTAAKAAKLEGRATIACHVDGEGRLGKCQLINEAPVGAGFGDAALALADRFQMKPVDQNGMATAGQKVRIPFKFALPSAPAA
jgi:TonB family protein